MELAGGGAVCYAPSRLGKLVLRITGFPRVTHQCHQSQQQEDSHHRETRHLYLGFHHPWDRDLWKSWIKQVSQTHNAIFTTTEQTLFLRWWPFSWNFPFLYFFSFYFIFLLFFIFLYFFFRYVLRLRGEKSMEPEEKIRIKIFSLKFRTVSRDKSIEMNYGIPGTI